MKAILRLSLILALFCLPALPARNSREFSLPLTSDVRVGDTQLPKGNAHVTWTETSGSVVQLTITAQNKKTVTVPARMIEEKHRVAGSVTSLVNGIEYLKELQSTKARFVIQ